MKYLTFSLLIGFVAISLWGFGSMSHKGSYMNDACIASTMDKTVCPQGALTTIKHHVNAYQTFFQAILFSPFAFLLLIGSLFFVGFVFSKNFLDVNFFLRFLQFVRYRKRHPDLSPRQSKSVVAWLSLFELSPAL